MENFKQTLKIINVGGSFDVQDGIGSFFPNMPDTELDRIVQKEI